MKTDMKTPFTWPEGNPVILLYTGAHPHPHKYTRTNMCKKIETISVWVSGCTLYSKTQLSHRMLGTMATASLKSKRLQPGPSDTAARERETEKKRERRERERERERERDRRKQD